METGGLLGHSVIVRVASSLPKRYDTILDTRHPSHAGREISDSLSRTEIRLEIRMIRSSSYFKYLPFLPDHRKFFGALEQSAILLIVILLSCARLVCDTGGVQFDEHYFNAPRARHVTPGTAAAAYLIDTMSRVAHSSLWMSVFCCYYTPSSLRIRFMSLYFDEFPPIQKICDEYLSSFCFYFLLLLRCVFCPGTLAFHLLFRTCDFAAFFFVRFWSVSFLSL